MQNFFRDPNQYPLGQPPRKKASGSASRERSTQRAGQREVSSRMVRQPAMVLAQRRVLDPGPGTSRQRAGGHERGGEGGIGRDQPLTGGLAPSTKPNTLERKVFQYRKCMRTKNYIKGNQEATQKALTEFEG